MIVALSAFSNTSRAHEIISAEQVSADMISILVKTPYYCNNPIAELEYLFSGRAKFGPYHYKLDVIALNRQYCFGEEEVSILAPIPSDLKHNSILVIHGDNDSIFTLEIKRAESQ